MPHIARYDPYRKHKEEGVQMKVSLRASELRHALNASIQCLGIEGMVCFIGTRAEAEVWHVTDHATMISRVRCSAVEPGSTQDAACFMHAIDGAMLARFLASVPAPSRVVLEVGPASVSVTDCDGRKHSQGALPLKPEEVQRLKSFRPRFFRSVPVAMAVTWSEQVAMVMDLLGVHHMHYALLHADSVTASVHQGVSWLTIASPPPIPHPTSQEAVAKVRTIWPLVRFIQIASKHGIGNYFLTQASEAMVLWQGGRMALAMPWELCLWSPPGDVRSRGLRCALRRLVSVMNSAEKVGNLLPLARMTLAGRQGSLILSVHGSGGAIEWVLPAEGGEDEIEAEVLFPINVEVLNALARAIGEGPAEAVVGGADTVFVTARVGNVPIEARIVLG